MHSVELGVVILLVIGAFVVGVGAGLAVALYIGRLLDPAPWPADEPALVAFEARTRRRHPVPWSEGYVPGPYRQPGEPFVPGG